jgi:hypothetical protein
MEKHLRGLLAGFLTPQKSRRSILLREIMTAELGSLGLVELAANLRATNGEL